MLNQTLAEKYFPKSICDLPFESNFKDTIKKFIDINLLHTIFISDDYFSKNILITTIVNEFNLSNNDILYVSNFKDQGVSNIRSEVKLFSQVPSSNKKYNKLLIIEDIDSFSENIQKLFTNNIDKWSNNLNIIITCNNVYSIDESLASRLLSISIPNITYTTIKKHINTIITNENIDIDDEIIKYIISISDLNIQILYNILQKCLFLQKKIKPTLDLIKISCTTINRDTLNDYFLFLKKKQITLAYKHLLKIVDNGHSVIDILNELYSFIKHTDILTEKQKFSCFKIVSNYIVTFITIHEEELELLLFTNDMINIL